MKLQPAMMFGENMVLQRGEPVPVWGRSVRGDTVTVTAAKEKISFKVRRNDVASATRS